MSKGSICRWTLSSIRNWTWGIEQLSKSIFKPKKTKNEWKKEKNSARRRRSIHSMAAAKISVALVILALDALRYKRTYARAWSKASKMRPWGGEAQEIEEKGKGTVLGALEAEDAELLRGEDGAPLLLTPVLAVGARCHGRRGFGSDPRKKEQGPPPWQTGGERGRRIVPSTVGFFF
jgi:hypothetical protein